MRTLGLGGQCVDKRRWCWCRKWPQAQAHLHSTVQRRNTNTNEKYNQCLHSFTAKASESGKKAQAHLHFTLSRICCFQQAWLKLYFDVQCACKHLKYWTVWLNPRWWANSDRMIRPFTFPGSVEQGPNQQKQTPCGPKMSAVKCVRSIVDHCGCIR